MSPKGRSFIFFDILQKLDFQKDQRVPPSTISKTLRFLSLGYGADFRRSRLVFRHTTELTLYVPLFSTYFIWLREYSGREFESLLQPETFSCICKTGRN